MRIRRAIPLLLCYVCLFASGSILVLAQGAPVPWEPWASLDLQAVSEDGTGSTFVIADVDGVPALQITPGGSSDETKLAYPVSGEDMQAWANSPQLQMDVYLPETNAVNPSGFFLGLASTTPEWAWIGGTFGTPSGSSSWITVSFPLDDVIAQIDPAGTYMLYLSFFEQANKTPLTEPFYVGAIHLAPGGLADSTPVAAQYQQDAAALLGMDNAAFIEVVARETFDYFWFEANPETGLVRDRSTESSPASIAAVGFGLAAIPIGVERGWITADEGAERAALTLNTFLSGGVQGEHGFYYHFVDMQTGERVWDSELSSIDTALLAAGALVAGQYFTGTEIETLAQELVERIEWDWMTDGGEFVRMGWTPENGFLDAAWDHFDESQILYVLAIGSPTHPISASAWEHWQRPLHSDDESIYLPGDPLFVYQYPQAFLHLRGLEDAFANYWNNTVRACDRHYAYIADNHDIFATYGHGAWGLSASDGPEGYQAYGATDVNNDGTIAPYASAACLPFTPEIALDGMRALLSTYGERVWREYGFVSAINEDADWYSVEHIGIDQGDILLMLANAQDGLVWNLFMANPSVHAALEAMGCVESSGDYAVTPAFWEAQMGR